MNIRNNHKKQDKTNLYVEFYWDKVYDLFIIKYIIGGEWDYENWN